MTAPTTTPNKPLAEASGPEVRAWARAQRNEDGTPKFTVSDRGRLSREVKSAYGIENG